jgi:hypothetical protein
VGDEFVAGPREGVVEFHDVFLVMGGCGWDMNEVQEKVKGAIQN